MSDEKEITLQLYFACAKRGDVEGLEETKIDVKTVDDLGNSALHWAASGHHPDCVQHLVENRKADVNLKNQNGDTPLHEAAWRGALSVVKYLCEKTDANLKEKNKEGKRPVDLARHLEVKAYLQSFEGDDEEEDNEGNASDNE